MKNIVRRAVKSIPPLYRQINRYRGWRIHDVVDPLPTVEVGGDGGPHNYGSWSIPRDSALSESSIVYSAGIGFDASFDKDIIRRFGCNVYAFDPGEEVNDFISTMDLPSQFKFQKVAIGIIDGTHSFTKSTLNSYSASDGAGDGVYELSTRRISSIMAGYDHKQIDLLKMDIEGFEYDVINQLLEMKIFPKCILVEFHHKQFTVPEKTRRSVSRLEAAGYRNYWISELGAEYGFLRD